VKKKVIVILSFILIASLGGCNLLSHTTGGIAEDATHETEGIYSVNRLNSLSNTYDSNHFNYLERYFSYVFLN